MGIDIATWRARIGLNYYHMCHPLRTRWRSSSGRVYQPGMASWGVGEVMDDTPLVLKGCITVVALSLILQYVVHSWSKLKGRGGGCKVRCHCQRTAFQVRGTVDDGGTLLLKAIAVVIPLLLVIAGDVETNPGPEELTLKALLHALHPARASWYNIGLELDIKYTELDNFKQNYSDQLQLMREMLKYWLKTAVDPPPTWEAVVTALKSPLVNEMSVAAQLERKLEESEGQAAASSVEEKSMKQSSSEIATNVTSPSLKVPSQNEKTSPEGTSLATSPGVLTSVSPTTCTTRHSTPPSEESAQEKPQLNMDTEPDGSSTSPPPSEGSQKPPFGCGCGKCTFFSFIESGCPTPTPSASSFPYLNLSGLTQWQQQELRGRLRYESQEIMIKFQKLVLATIKSLQEQCVSLDNLVSHVMALGAFDPVFKEPQVPVFHHCFNELKAADTIPKVFLVLNNYFSFFNYHILEHIIEELGAEEDKSRLQTYKEHFNQYAKRKIFECPSEIGPVSDTDHADIFVKLDSQCEIYTIAEIEVFCHKLSEIVHISSQGILRLCRVDKGCFELTFQVPSFVQQEVFPLSRGQEMVLEDEGVIQLKCGQYHFSSNSAKKHGNDQVQYVYTSVYGGYLKEIYNSEQRPIGIGPPTPTENLLPFKLARIEKEEVGVDEFTGQYIRGDMDDVGSFGTEIYKKYPIKFEEVGKLLRHHQTRLILIEGAAGVGKTTFSWEFCRKWGKDEIFQNHSLLLLIPLRDSNLKAAKTLSDLFYHPNSELQQAVVQEVTSNQGRRVAIWLEAWDELNHELRQKASVFLDLIHGRILPFATVFVTSRPWASKHLRENCELVITQHVEILTSANDQIEHYICKAEEEQPSTFAAKFAEYLSFNPVIKAAMYTPVTAKMAAELFTWNQRTGSPSPTTMTELFTAFTLKTLVDHLSTHPVYHKLQLKVTTFSELPTDVYKQFHDLCRLAYEGILNRQQLVFSAAHLPTGFAPLGLMQEVPQLYIEGGASSYHFIHLTLQEYLAAVHISQLPGHEQARLFQEHVDSGYFERTIKFLAGRTNLANMPSDVTKCLMETDDTKLTYFHFLFEAKDFSVTTKSLELDEMVVRPRYYWTPLDYYVTGHAISHSSCTWRLFFRYSSIDDEKFELFCQGLAAPGATECRGHISHANFSENGISSKSIQSFVNIPPCITQKTIELELHHNKLDESACDLLAKATPSMSRLRRLWLSYNSIGSGGAVEVIKALCGSGVVQLFLDNTGIGVPDCEALCELLKSSHSLEELKIHENNLSSKSVASIIIGLSHNSSLTTLDISNSHFSMADVDSLASVLKDHSKCTLKELNLQNCQISSKGAVELTAGLSKNTTLKHLNLSHNPIGAHEDGVAAVAKLLEVCGDHSNFTLTQLELRDCRISGQGARKVAAALCENSTLKYLNLNHNHIGVEGASSISDMLRHNKSLEVLHLRNESVGEEGVHKLINNLKHNQTLRKLVLPKTYKTENGDQRIEWY